MVSVIKVSREPVCRTLSLERVSGKCMTRILFLCMLHVVPATLGVPEFENRNDYRLRSRDIFLNLFFLTFICFRETGRDRA